MAQGFKARYADCVTSGLEPDQTFREMVIFAGGGERLELTHRAEDRSLFARGAIKAAQWAFPQKPGYYTMADVLGLSDQASS